MAGSEYLQRGNAADLPKLCALEQSEVAIGLTDTSGCITWANPAFASLSGYELHEIEGQGIGTFRSDRHNSTFYDGIESTLASGATWSGRMAIAKKNGDECRVRVIAAPIADERGHHLGYSIFARDSTEESRFESQIAQLQKMEAIGELAAGIAHEINTPIQYVGDNIQFLQQSIQDILEFIEMLETACNAGRSAPVPPATTTALAQKREAIDLDFLREELPLAIDQAMEGRNRVAAIVRVMKEFAHPGDEALTPIDMNHAIENTLAVSRGEWKRVADVETNLDPAMPPVPCYPGSFNQVLLNLVVNAAHAIADKQEKGERDKGIIAVTTGYTGDTATVSIRDTGCGIPEQAVHRIFEPFYTTKDVGKGTGQGLALVHAVIVDKMHGRISVDSTPGLGTTFTLYVPLESAAQETDGAA